MRQFGRDRIDGIVRNDSQVEACTKNNQNCGSGDRRIRLLRRPEPGAVQAEGLAALGDRVWEDLNANGIQDCEDTNGNGILGDVDPLDPGNPAVSDQGTECGDSRSAAVPVLPVYP